MLLGLSAVRTGHRVVFLWYSKTCSPVYFFYKHQQRITNQLRLHYYVYEVITKQCNLFFTLCVTCASTATKTPLQSLAVFFARPTHQLLAILVSLALFSGRFSFRTNITRGIGSLGPFIREARVGNHKQAGHAEATTTRRDERRKNVLVMKRTRHKGVGNGCMSQRW